MRALAAFNDISGVERVIDEMKRDGRVTADWTTYSNLASIYVDAGQNVKAENALKELEKKNVCKDLSAFQFLITLYGRTGNLLEVYCVWQSNCSTHDIRIGNALIGAYMNEILLDKAIELKAQSKKKGAKPNAKTWEIFLNYYLKEGNFKSAVDCVAKAISTGRGDESKWIPQTELTQRLMGHFEQNKDVESAERLVEILKKAVDEVGADVFESLIRTYVAAGRTNPIMHRRIKMGNVDLSAEGIKLLDAVYSK